MNPYSLLKPVRTVKPDKEAVLIKKPQTLAEVRRLIQNLEPLVAVDIETKGNKVHDKDSHVVGIGVADSKSILYFDIKNCHISIYYEVLKCLKEKTLFGFNINFDAAYFHRDYSNMVNQPISGANLDWHDWQYDVYGLYKQLANEGWAGQEWNLKSAQIDLLGWDEKGNVELNKWLIDNNHYTSVSLEPTSNNVKTVINNEVRYARPDMAQMYLAPSDILGYYCGLDAASTYQLLFDVFMPAIQQLPSLAQDNFWFYHSELFITNVKWHIEQQLRGIKIDKHALQNYTGVLNYEINKSKDDFLKHKDIKPHLVEWNQIKIKELSGKQPYQFTKKGTVNKNYLSYLAKQEKLHNTEHFNMNSGAQRQWLFYEKLKHPVILRTEKGSPAVDKKALLAWGEPGKILKLFNDKTKELGYVQSCIEQLEMNADGLLHPQYRLPGTLTCRIAGAGSFNIQQQPKAKDYLKHWLARDNMVWIDADIESLEAVVLAELSKDETMRYLYDPSSPKNDIYLYVGSFLPVIGDAIKSAGYDPEAPTVEGIASAKKLAKQERQIAKTCVLGFQYGMGPKKLKQSLALEGIKLSDNQSFEIYKAYWDLFSGIKTYTTYLEQEWRKRGGWVYNGIGRPIGCYEPFLRDIVNRVVQSTGHDVLMYVNYQLYNLRNHYDIDFHGIIIDWHDASLVETDKANVNKVLDIFIEAYKLTNEWLKGDLAIRTKPQIVHNLSESKCE